MESEEYIFKNDVINTSTKTSFGEKQVNIRLNDKFKEICENDAKNNNVSLNEWIRRAMVSRLSGDDEYKSKRIAELSNELASVQYENKHLHSENESIKKKLSEIYNHYNEECNKKDKELIVYKNENDNLTEIVHNLKAENKELQEKIDRLFTDGRVDSNKLESMINSIISERLTEIHPNLLVSNEDVPKYFDIECPNCHIVLKSSAKICPVCKTDLSKLDEKTLRFNENAKKELRKGNK